MSQKSTLMKISQAAQEQALELLKTLWVKRPDKRAPMTERGNSKYYTEPTALTDANLLAHLDGRETYAAPLIGADGQCLATVIDIDVGGQEAVTAALKAAAHQELVAFGLIQDAPDKLSNHQGGHVWLLFDSPCPPEPLQRLTVELRKVANLRSGETYPSGSNIRLPFGFHRRKKSRGRLLLQDGREYQLDNEADLNAGILAVCSLPKNEPPAVSRELVENASGHITSLPTGNVQPWSTCPDLPIEAEVLKDAQYWLENVGMLMNQDGIPIRMGNATNALSYRILTGQCRDYDHDTSLRRYKLMEGLLRFGYPPEEAIPLCFHLGRVEHKSSEWQLRDAASIFLKVRATLGMKYRPSPSRTYYDPSGQNTQSQSIALETEATVPRPRGRPRKCPDISTAYQWLLERVDVGWRVLAGARTLAEEWKISHRSWRGIEKKLADEGLARRVTPKDKRHCYLEIITVQKIHPPLKSTVREILSNCAENAPGEADAQCAGEVFCTVKCADGTPKNVSPHARAFGGAPPFPPNPQEADSLSPTPHAPPVLPASLDDDCAQPPSPVLPALPDDDQSQPASPDDDQSQPASPDDDQSQPASPDDDQSQPASPDDDQAQPALPVSPASPDDDGDTSNPSLRDLVADALDAGCKRKSQVVWYVQANSSQPFSEQAITYWLRRERQERSLAAEIEEATPAALVKKISACDSHIAESHKRRDQGYRYWLYRRVQFWEALERRGYDPAQELDRLHEERRPKKRKKGKARRNEARQTGLSGL